MAVYCPSRITTTLSDWDAVFSLCTNKTIIAGDFYAHHSNWSRRADTRGSYLFDCLIDYNFVSLNDQSHTRIKLVDGILQKSSPDITFASADIALRFNWKVSNESLGSDHLVIMFNTYIAPLQEQTFRRNFKKTDWEKYKCILEFSFSNDFNFRMIYKQITIGF